MNLFISYSPEETRFLLEIGEKHITRNVHNFFHGLDVHKLEHFKKKKLSKKDIVRDFEYILVEKGKVGVVKNNKVVKILQDNDCFGVLHTFLKEDYILLALEESEVTFFGIGSYKEAYENILRCVAKKLNGKILI